MDIVCGNTDLEHIYIYIKGSGFILQLGVLIDEKSVDGVIIAHVFIHLELKLLI